jgi:hypothetical protein
VCNTSARMRRDCPRSLLRIVYELKQSNSRSELELKEAVYRYLELSYMFLPFVFYGGRSLYEIPFGKKILSMLRMEKA